MFQDRLCSSTVLDFTLYLNCPQTVHTVLEHSVVLNCTQDIDIKLIIPGHGPVKQKKEAITPMLNYFNRLINQIRNYHQKNASLNEALSGISSENKESWLLYNIYHPSNVTKVYTELEWE